MDINTSPALIDYLNQLPIKTVDGEVIRVSEVAHVRDGSDPQQNIVRQDGMRSTLISALKNGAASTLDVADGVKRAMAATLKTLAGTDVTVSEFIDQSLFVRSAVSGVGHELDPLLFGEPLAEGGGFHERFGLSLSSQSFAAPLRA